MAIMAMLSLREVMSIMAMEVITKKLIFGFQILDLKDHFSASLKKCANFHLHTLTQTAVTNI